MTKYLLTACVHGGDNSAMLTYLTNSVYTLNWGGWLLETLNWVPGVHDKVPLLLGGSMPFLNPR